MTNIRARQGSARQAAPPECFRHKTTMVFMPDTMRWQCVMSGCTIVAYPKHDIENGKPIVAHGSADFISSKGRYFIRSGNVFIDVTSNVRDIIPGKVTDVTMCFSDVIEVDGF